MAIVPQLSLFYDQLPLALIPARLAHSVVLAALSWVAWFLWYPSRALPSNIDAARPWILLFLYLPALLVLLSLRTRENVGDEGPQPATADTLAPSDEPPVR
jgi:hypothetical protein